jgi:serine/threonine protein kinase
MIGASGESLEVAEWRFIIPASAHDRATFVRKAVVENVVAALRGEDGAPFRRSRHATTWKVQVAGSSGEAVNVFVKQLDVARGLMAWAKAKSRPPRSVHVLRISDSLRRDNFGVPRVLLIGENRDTGNEAIVTSAAPGFMLTRWMNPSHRADLTLRRGILHQLGREIAGLHLSGYIHGDLTPYNIFATGDQPAAISFIDHEGTARTSWLTVNVVRNRMRNLVQLGHFDLAGVSRTDKLRVFTSYAAATGVSGRGRRQALIRLTKMIERRRKRDRAIKRGATQPAIIAEEGAARG